MFKALTMEATPEWFFTQMFYCTSSSTDRLLVELKKKATDGDAAIFIDPETLLSLTRVLSTVHGPGRNQRYV